MATRRRVARLWALVGACALAIWLIVDTPFGLSYPNYEAHGFSMLTFANRVLRWDDTRLEHVLIAVAIVVTILLAVLSSSTRRVARPLGIVLIAATLLWTTSAEIYGARGENELTARFYGALPKPADWLDRTDGGKRAVFLGQSITDANALWSLEFWNRSLKRMWSLDASAPGPGRVLTASWRSQTGRSIPRRRRTGSSPTAGSRSGPIPTAGSSATTSSSRCMGRSGSARPCAGSTPTVGWASRRPTTGTTSSPANAVWRASLSRGSAGAARTNGPA